MAGLRQRISVSESVLCSLENGAQDLSQKTLSKQNTVAERHTVVSRESKSREVAQPQKQGNKWFHTKSRFEHTHSSTLAPPDGWSGTLITLCTHALVCVIKIRSETSDLRLFECVS